MNHSGIWAVHVFSILFAVYLANHALPEVGSKSEVISARAKHTCMRASGARAVKVEKGVC